MGAPPPESYERYFVPAIRKPLAGRVSGADASARAAFETDALGAWARSSRGEGVELDQPMVHARAFK